MKTKKNAGFSLVELIVVIAIMAVLVGVLAPAYLKYVEKSRKSSDVSAISEMMTSANNTASDNEVNMAENDTFTIMWTTSNATVETRSSNKTAETAWNEVIESSYTIKAKAFKKDATITGTVKDTGAVVWGGIGTGFVAMVSYSSDFGAKFEE
jgi:type IV pilus assembly protein PilA